MRLHTRFGVSVCLTIFLIVSIILLLPSARIATHLHKFPFGDSLNNYRNGIWKGWGSPEDDEVEGGVRIVVFGDSWVDDAVEEGETGRGRSWVDVVCEEVSSGIQIQDTMLTDQLNCTSQLNFAASQPSKAYPAAPPTGAITSNYIYLTAVNVSNPEHVASTMLPDLATQIEEYIELPSSTKVKTTVFVVSFGFWDIYQYASLDFKFAQDITDTTVTELFAQLDILHSHYAKQLSSGLPEEEAPEIPADTGNSTEETEIVHRPLFRVIIPKLFDPTLLPGWISQRPIPLRPSSVAEEQKNAVYLTNKWNILLENKIREWVKAAPPSNPEQLWDTYDPESSAAADLEKDVFYYDLPSYLLDVIVEHHLEDEDISDATGLGTGDSPFGNVSESCVSVGITMGEERNGKAVCKEAKEYLWWDAFNLGGVANEFVGKAVGQMMKEGKGVRGDDDSGWLW